MIFPQIGAFAAAESICTRCALCCNGAMFDWVRTSEEELAALPITPSDRAPAAYGTGFSQSCSLLRGTPCSAYANRPAPCRKFECRLLKAVNAREIDRGDALGTIATARRLLDEVRSLLRPGESLPAARARWRSWFAGGTSEAPSPADGEFVLRMTMLNRVLDRHFRKESKQQTVEMAAS